MMTSADSRLMTAISPFQISILHSHEKTRDSTSHILCRGFVKISDILIVFGLVSLFNGISTFVGYLIPKPFS